MKILITNTGPWGTGSFTVARAIMEELVDLGHEVKVFFPDMGLPCQDLEYYHSKRDVYEIWQFPIQEGRIRLDTFPLIIPDPHPRNPKGRTFLQLKDLEYKLYLDDFERKIQKLIEDFQPDIIECQHIWAFDHIIKKLNYPYICVAHHSDQLGFRYDKRMRPTAIESAKNAEYIFSISNFVKKEVISLYGVKEKKVIVLPNGYDKKVFKVFKSDRKKVLKDLGLRIPDDAIIMTFAGKISRTKGIDILLQANRLIDPNKKIHFIIFGSGDIENVVSKEEKELCCFDRVHFLGHQPAKILAKVHNIAKICVMPSRSEGFGIACLESMACGLPVIVTKIGGVDEYAIGKVINSGSFEELAESIVEMVNLSDHEYKMLSNKALRAANRFSWKTITAKRVTYYKELLRK